MAGTMDCQAGAMKAVAVPMASVNRISSAGVIISKCTRTVRTLMMTNSRTLTVINILRLSTRSASVPA